MTQKEQKVFEELLQMGFDFDVISSVGVHPYPSTEEELGKLAERFTQDFLVHNR